MYTRKPERLDLILILLVIGLTIFGIVVIGSATRINLPGVEPLIYRAQIKWFITGLFLMFSAALIDYGFYGKYHLLPYFAIVVLLVLVLMFADEVRGSARWISIAGFRMQPSEFAKVVVIFCLAKVISKNEERINNPIVLLLIILFVLVIGALVYKQPSLSVSLIILVILAVELFAGGLSYKYIFTLFAIFLPFATLMYIDAHQENPRFADELLGEYQLNRIRALSAPEEYKDVAYQSMKSLTALGSGELEGKGLYQGSLNQISDLPDQHNDFIFTIIGEEFGFIGCVTVLAVLLLIILRCAIIAYRACDTFGRLIAAGTAGMLAFQTFVHCGVTMAFLPTTGMGLPFLSYGGSSLWTNYIAIGLVLNVGLKQQKSFFEGG